MITTLVALAGSLWMAQPADALVGVWRAQDMSFVFYSNNDARFVYLDRFGYLGSVRPVPDGTWLGYWVARDVPAFADVNGPLTNRGRIRVPDASGALQDVPRASQGHWRAKFTKTDDKGYPSSANLTMQTSRPSALVDGELTFVCGLDRVSISGDYGDEQVKLSVSLDGSTLAGTLEAYKLRYRITARAKEGLMVSTLVDPSSGETVGSCTIAWYPTSNVLSRLSQGQSVPTDRVLIHIASSMDKQRANILKTLKRR